MGKISKDKIAISGTTGFIGKNLENFFTQNNVKYKTISRLACQKNKLSLISDCNCSTTTCLCLSYKSFISKFFKSSSSGSII